MIQVNPFALAILVFLSSCFVLNVLRYFILIKQKEDAKLKKVKRLIRDFDEADLYN